MLEINGRLFDWDTEKNLTNIKKHGISFKMAASSFFDSEAIIFTDDRHSQHEDRFILIGLNKIDDLLIVCHCYRNEGNLTRIISAREANSHEKDIYEGGGEE